MDGGRNCSDTTVKKDSKKIKATNEIADLPDSILTDILLRLPVKSLVKFRCVSKFWFSLISSRRFVKAHLEFSSGNADFTKHKVMFTLMTDHSSDLKQCSVSSLVLERSTVASDVDYPDKMRENVWVVGSCDGIICIEIDDDVTDVFLWNPSTRKFKKLPVDVELRDGCFHARGFGYSESEDDYKVVGMFYSDGVEEEIVVKIYSLRNDSWKRIENFRYGIPSIDTATFASGKLHFETTSPDELDLSWNIVSLDLNNESYAIVEEPNYGDGILIYSLGLLGGCLSVLCNYQRTRADVWILKEYGVKESWTRVVSVPYYSRAHEILQSHPFFMAPNGEIFLILSSSLVAYNPKDKSLKRHLISNCDDFAKAHAYIESLVPL